MQAANQIANQIAVKIIQTGAKDGGNLRPFYIVAKAINLSASNDRDNLVGLWIGDEALCHVSLGATPMGRYNANRLADLLECSRLQILA